MSATHSAQHIALPFTVSAIPADEVHSQPISTIQTSNYEARIDHFRTLYRVGDNEGALKLAHQLLYEKEIPLSIRFKVSSLSNLTSRVS